MGGGNGSGSGGGINYYGVCDLSLFAAGAGAHSGVREK